MSILTTMRCATLALPILLANAACVAAVQSSGDGNAAKTDFDSLRATLLRSLETIKEHYSTCRGIGKYRLERLADPDKGVVLSWDIDFAVKRDAVKFIAYHQKRGVGTDRPAFDDIAGCIGPKSTFLLSRKKDTTSFVIRSLSDDPRDQRSITHRVIPRIASGFNPRGFSLLDYLKQDPDFGIVKAEKINEDGKSMWRIEFRGGDRPPPGVQAYVLVKEAWAVVSPSEGWAIRRFETHNVTLPQGYETYCGGEIEYSGVDNGVPLLKRIEAREETKDREPHIVESFDLDKLDFEPEPDSSFTLAAFGLPEGKIDASRAKSTRTGHLNTILWILGTAFLVGAVGLKIYSFKAASRDRSNEASA